MKPLEIKMKFFGPFKDAEIDFQKLDEMFLLCGDTGAGKTSVFDGMAYALYGKLLGERNAKDFVSKFAPLGEESFVEFTFEIRGKKYRVKRTMPYPYKKRGGEISEKPTEVLLEEFGAEKKFVPVGYTKSETDSFLEKLLGLNFAQFRQVVVLPQGDFAKFLKASSNEKSEILKKIFPIQHYEKICTMAKEKFQAAQREFSACEKSLNEFQCDETEAEKKIAELAEKISAEKSAQNLAEKKREEILGEKTRLEEKLSDAGEREISEKKLRELSAQETQIKNLEEKILLARQADSVLPFIVAKKKAAEEKKISEEKYAKNLAREKELDAELKKLQDEKPLVEKKLLAAEENKKRLTRLEADKKTLSEFLAAQKKFLAEESERKKSAEKLSVLQKKISEEFECMKKTAAEFLDGENFSSHAEIVKNLLMKKSAVEKEFSDAKKNLEESKKCESLREKIRGTEKELQKIRGEFSAEEKQIDGIKKILDELEARKKLQEENECALILVPLLKDGEACPVCGSKIHPAPACRLDGELNVAEKILVQKKSLDDAQKKSVLLSNKISSLDAEQKNLQEQLAENSQGKKILSAEEAEEKFLQAEKISGKFFCVLDECEKSEGKLDALMADAEKLKSELQEKTETVSSLKSRSDTLENQISPDCTKDESAAAEKISSVRGEILRDENWCNQEKEKLSRAETESAKIKSVLCEEEKSAESAARKFAAAEKELAEKIASTKFGSEGEAQEAVMGDDEISSAEGRVKKFGDEKKSLETTIKVLREKCAENSADVEKIIGGKKSELEKISAEIQSHQNSAETFSREKISAENSLAQYRKIRGEWEKISRELEPLKKLNDDLNGANPKKMKFDAWFLSVYFLDVVATANRYLLKISGERYEFKISTENSGGAGFRGLDLLVHDYQNNHDRDSSTLSGGETFMASISLALGMTEVINQKNAALDSLFIDEGFGSLDKNSLDMAVNVLQSVGADKTVGLISHVEELKAAIASRVEIVKKPEGSEILVYG